MTHQFDAQAFIRRMEAAGMARGVADALGSVMPDGWVTRRDLGETEMRLDGHLRETELRLRQDLKELAPCVMLRLGAMLGGATALTIATLGALITLK